MMVFEACLKPLLQAQCEDQDSAVSVNNKLKVDLTNCRGIGFKNKMYMYSRRNQTRAFVGIHRSFRLSSFQFNSFVLRHQDGY